MNEDDVATLLDELGRLIGAANASHIAAKPHVLSALSSALDAMQRG